jgi:predicted transposase YdaD
VYVLLEHQSSPDGLMAFRMLRYVVRIWDEFLRIVPSVATTDPEVVKPARAPPRANASPR